jgi:hypothetical protein
LFWENGKAVLENWWVCLHGNSIELKRKSQYLYNRYRTCFRKELSVETTGAAFVPILNALDYNLFLPGNWK